MLRLTEIRLPVTEDPSVLRATCAKRLRVPLSDLMECRVEHRTIDARKKPDLFYTYTVLVTLHGEKTYRKKHLPSGVSVYREPVYSFPWQAPDGLCDRPVIVGSGPAGLFCAYQLALHGFRPIVLERGDDVGTRQKKVRHFWETGELDPESNVQFGEGGAGTFSDGKLYTGIKDPSGRNREVLRIFVSCGAPSEIRIDTHAHLGTDQLSAVVHTMREKILAMGGTVLFGQRVDALLYENGCVRGVRTQTGDSFASPVVVLATGHSARDTFRMLAADGLAMEAKPFAVGLRIRHPQEIITRAQYGEAAPAHLGAASYKLTAKGSAAAGPLYSFCMCPGGYVINASSETGRLAVNGMSTQARDSGFANSALVSPVSPAACQSLLKGDADPLFAGLLWQEQLEEKAYALGGGAIPAQRVSDFAAGRPGNAGDAGDGCLGHVEMADLRQLLPDSYRQSLLEGLSFFESRIPGFLTSDPVLYGIESRTSSPVRILRDKTRQGSVPGLYPCGEGAGYAGGILSAASDGLKVAEAVAEKMSKRVESGYTNH